MTPTARMKLVIAIVAFLSALCEPPHHKPVAFLTPPPTKAHK